MKFINPLIKKKIKNQKAELVVFISNKKCQKDLNSFVCLDTPSQFCLDTPSPHPSQPEILQDCDVLVINIHDFEIHSLATS